jgi:methionyl-tRNA formyltransferase
MQPLSIAFFGSAPFSVPGLAALLDAGCEVRAVYTRPPRPAGRGHRPQRSPVHDYAEAHGIAVRTPVRLRDEEEHARFASLGVDAGVVAAYGLILPQPILRAPRLGCLNIHASLLPRWRGAAPIQRAILAGDAVTGVTIMQMDPGLDTGAIVLAEAVPIGPDTTAAALHDTLAALGARLIVPALAGIAAGTLAPRPQPAEGVTYAAKLTRDEGRLDWRQRADLLERAVRAFTPWPGAWFSAGSERIRVLAAAVIPGVIPDVIPGGGAPAAPGTVLDDAPTIACGTGSLRLLRLQRAGRAEMDAAEMLRGFALPVGTRLA